jgi:hypothetical protein
MSKTMCFQKHLLCQVSIGGQAAACRHDGSWPAALQSAERFLSGLILSTILEITCNNLVLSCTSIEKSALKKQGKVRQAFYC